MEGAEREGRRGRAGSSCAGRAHPFLLKVVTFVKGACPYSVHAWKRFIQKLLQAAQVFFFGGGRGEGLTFTSFGRRMYDS